MFEEMCIFVLLVQIGLIVCVVECLLFMQLVVIKQIQWLECVLDMVLFDWCVKLFCLIVEGEVVLVCCCVIVGEFEVLCSSVCVSGELEGLLCVGVSYVVGDVWFVCVLLGLWECFLGVLFCLSCEWGGVLCECLKCVELDVVLWLMLFNVCGNYVDVDICVIGIELVSLIVVFVCKLLVMLLMVQVIDEVWVLNFIGCEMCVWFFGCFEVDWLMFNVVVEV